MTYGPYVHRQPGKDSMKGLDLNVVWFRFEGKRDEMFLAVVMESIPYGVHLRGAWPLVEPNCFVSVQASEEISINYIQLSQLLVTSIQTTDHLLDRTLN